LKKRAFRIRLKAVYLQKASGNAEPGQPKQSVPPQKAADLAGAKAKPVPALPAKAEAGRGAHSIHGLVTKAGIPADRLSASIVSFARFFSLPIKPQLMSGIRQQAFSAAPETAAGMREALSLAAAAAESKGVELSQKGLEAYAQALAPDRHRRQSFGAQDGRRHEGEKKGGFHRWADPLSAGGLREAALEAADKDPQLAVMNRLPGKDGRRWIVLPFGFELGEKEYRVSMRVLLDGNTAAANQAGRMVLDVAESPKNRDGPELRRLFALESPNAAGMVANAAGTVAKLTVYLEGGLDPAKAESLASELAVAVGVAAGRVSVKSRTDAFPCESSDCPDDLLRSIYKTV